MARQEPDPTVAGPPADTPDKAELIAELAGARAGLAEGGAELAHHLDARERLVQAVRERPLLWAGAAAATGFAVAMFLRGGRRGRGGSTPPSGGGPSPGLTGTLAATVVSAVQPALAKYAQNALTKVVGGALHESPESDEIS